MKLRLTDKQPYEMTMNKKDDGFKVFTAIPYIPAKCKNLHVRADLNGKTFEYDTPITIGSKYKKIVANFEYIGFIEIETVVLDQYLLNDIKANHGRYFRNSYFNVPVMMYVHFVPTNYDDYDEERLFEVVKKYYDNSKLSIDLDYVHSNIVIEMDRNRDILRIYVDEDW